jgi:hypothetical protein
MVFSRLARFAAAFFAVLALTLGTACNRSAEEKEIRDLTKKAAELDKLNQDTHVTGTDQAKKLKEAGADVKLNAETMQLSEEQKRVLEERIKSEKNSSYAALLQEVIEKDKEIKELNEKIAKLRAILPKPDVAKANDSHYGMAIRFLTKKKGISQEEAQKLVSRVNLMEKLAPGFEVYHFYSNGVYGSWVSQGKATITPNELQKQEREKIEGERDVAIAQSDKLTEELADLAAQKKKIQEDIAALQGEKEKMQKDMEALAVTNEAQKAKLNSLHFVVGDRKKLEKDGIIIVPVFAKDRAGEKWADGVFTRSLDLRTVDSITLTAAEVGLKGIGKVSIVPGSLEKDKHYTLTIAGDKQSAVVKFLAKDRFKNEKVVFAVSE